MATTERTLDEAKDYIEDSITQWIMNGEEHKIISLANFAERKRSKKENPWKNMADLHKNINSYKSILERNKKIDPTADNNVIEAILADAEKKYDELFDKHGEYEPRTRRPRKK